MRTKEFGEKVREIRAEKGMKQGTIAKTLNIYQSDLSALENRGERIQNFETLCDIAEFLGFEFTIVEKKTA